MQRNPDNYVLLRCTSNTASSISSNTGISSRIPPTSGGSGTGNSTSGSSSLTGSAPSNIHGECGNPQHGQGSSANSASSTTVASSSPSSSAASSTTASTATTAASTPQPNQRHGSAHAPHHYHPHHHSEIIADRTDFHITKVYK